MQVARGTDSRFPCPRCRSFSVSSTLSSPPPLGLFFTTSVSVLVWQSPDDGTLTSTVFFLCSLLLCYQDHLHPLAHEPLVPSKSGFRESSGCFFNRTLTIVLFSQGAEVLYHNVVRKAFLSLNHKRSSAQGFSSSSATPGYTTTTSSYAREFRFDRPNRARC